MKLYHRTPHGEKIISEGFRDSSGSYLTDHEFSGVFLSDRPVDANEGAKGEDLLAVELPEALLEQFEWVEEDKPYREFVVPAAVVNAHGPPVMVDEFA